MDALMFILALAPIIWLIVALLAFKMVAWKASIGSLLLAAVLAFSMWHLPVDEIATAALEGVLMAVWPITIVIVAAVFTYNVCVASGAMKNITTMICSISNDRRVLALLIAWCFGCFMEGVAGFGVAIAIPAGMMVAMGFNPITAILICLFANTAPTPFGSIGIPTLTLAGLVTLHPAHLAFVEMIQIAPFYIAAPFFVVFIAGGAVVEGEKPLPSLQRFKGMVGITLASGLSACVASFAVSYFVGAELTMVVGAIVSLGVTALVAARAEKRGKLPDSFDVQTEPATEAIDLKLGLKSWSSFIIIFVVLLFTSDIDPDIHRDLATFATTVRIFDGPNAAAVTFTWINTPGVWIFLAAIVGGLIQGVRPKKMLEVLLATFKQLWPTIITLFAVLGCSKVMGYAGMITDIAEFCIAITGPFYLLVAPWFGALGSFVTGSGTTAGILFGWVQGEAASALGINPYWTVGLTELGAAVGKMISPQSFAIGMAATNIKGKSPELMRAALPYALAFMVLVSIYAYFGVALLG